MGMPLDETSRWQAVVQAPAAVLAAAVALGIAADRFCPLPVVVWCLCAGVTMGLGWIGTVWKDAWRLVSSFRGDWAVWFTTVLLAAGWHHLHWNTLASDDLARLVSEDGQVIPVLLEGWAMSAMSSGAANPDAEVATPNFGRQARFRIQVRWLRRNGIWVPASGCIWVHVTGEVPFLRPGDQVVVSGNLARYRPPMNPAERDFRAIHWAQGERVFVRAPVATCVRVVPSSRLELRWWLPRLHFHGQAVLREELSPSAAELAIALLLGARDGLAVELRDQFMRTGTLHLLAISGLHVGILAAPWLFVARTGWVPFRFGLWCVVFLMALYAGVADGRASVVRASVLVQLLCFSWMTRRRSSFVNSLGCAALVVLAHNPADLFSSGTQLSFLAVAALGRCRRFATREGSEDPLDRLLRRTRPWWSRAFRKGLRQLMWMMVTSASVWLVTFPLIVEVFHVVSPIAVLLNLVICPLLAVGLQAGFGVLLFARICPPLAHLLAVVCDSCMQGMQTIVCWADAWPASHFWLVGPGAMAVGLSYACIASGWIVARRARIRVICYGLAFSCLLVGWSHQAWQRQRFSDRLRCTVLSVGHGTCVVLQLPGGQVWLYDAGRRGSIRSSVDAVSRYLWSQSIRHIDAVVLSHADVDHYSLVPGLLERFAVKRFLMTHQLLPAHHAGEAWLASHLRKSGIQAELIALGERWQFASGCVITVLHPDAGATYRNDNAGSVVLAITYQGMSILLPGDLESDGLESLLRSPPWAAEVVMAPHHGSLHGDPRRFLDWCRPQWCIVSGSDSDAGLRATWAQKNESHGTRARVLHTAVDGAIEVDIDVHGLRSQSLLSAE